jgi:hypothetical protein
MIRTAEQADVQKIADFLVEARKESPYYSRYDYDRRRGEAMIYNMMGNPKGVCFINEIDGEIVGVIMGELLPDLFTTGYIAVMHFAYAKRGSGLSLIKRFQRWASDWPQATTWFASTSFGGEKADLSERLFIALGMKRIGAQFVGEL